jgi:hypothetical protein
VVVVIGVVVVVRLAIACKGLKLGLGVLRGYAIVNGGVVICTCYGGRLSSSVIDRLRWPCHCGLLCYLIFFSFCEVGTLLGCVSLVWPTEMTVDF